MCAFSLLDHEDDLAYFLDASDAPDVHIGALVRYSFRGVDSFEGIVTDIDAAGRVEVEAFDVGETCWCAAGRLQVILCAAAVSVGGVA